MNYYNMNKQPIPTSLAGFQLVCNSYSRGGDLTIPRHSGLEDAEWDNGRQAPFATDGDGYSIPCGMFRVYRRSDPPRNLDATPAPEKAKTDDAGKAPLALLPWAAMDELAAVQAYGASKYGDFYNYRKGMEVSRNLSCAIRRIRDYMNGCDKDHESGCNPLGHALARLAFVLQNIKDGVAIDDRFKGAAKNA